MSYISSEGLNKLKEELKERTTTKRKELGKLTEEAKELGDLSENAEYQNAMELKSANEARVLKLQEIIEKAELIQSKKGNKQQVEVGLTVEVEIIDAGSKAKKTAKKMVLTIVGSHEADPALNKISNESPLGRALVGHRAGDAVEAETPRGKLKFRIKAIK